ncbi:prepilin-type N-terminal cleavage/methylation domain-containing protein [Candidatus Sumerlaeota bacterium]|nr:prepilin-type N-terminal cleavage/methylation domain-containing protein [Candidatus Sumerlaeota bacterium]
MKKAFSLIEIMVIMAIMGILIAIVVPGYLRAVENTRGQTCQENLAQIESAKEQWALEFKHSDGAPINDSNAFLNDANIFGFNGYIKKTPKCPASGTYGVNPIGADPTCSIGSSNIPFIPHVCPTRDITR